MNKCNKCTDVLSIYTAGSHLLLGHLKRATPRLLAEGVAAARTRAEVEEVGAVQCSAVHFVLCYMDLFREEIPMTVGITTR